MNMKNGETIPVEVTLALLREPRALAAFGALSAAEQQAVVMQVQRDACGNGFSEMF